MDGDTVHRIDGDLFGPRSRSGETVALADVKLLAPATPRTIVAVALNYASHGGSPSNRVPGIFLKPVSALVGPGDAIRRPPDSTSLHYEGELVLVIGKRATNISVEDAPGHILGVTAGNDVTERSYPFHPFHIVRQKGSDTFAPLGPVIATGLDYNRLAVTTRLNGKVVQQDTTASMIHPVDELVSFISRYITLEAGDLVYTGTPGTTRAMDDGDVVEVEIEGVGVLRNSVGR